MKLTAEDGQDGDTYYLEHQYSSQENQTDWHELYAQGDIWRRQRQVSGSTIGAWAEPERIRGEDGQDGWVPEFEVYYGENRVGEVLTGEIFGARGPWAS